MAGQDRERGALHGTSVPPGRQAVEVYGEYLLMTVTGQQGLEEAGKPYRQELFRYALERSLDPHRGWRLGPRAAPQYDALAQRLQHAQEANPAPHSHQTVIMVRHDSARGALIRTAARRHDLSVPTDSRGLHKIGAVGRKWVGGVPQPFRAPGGYRPLATLRSG